jgi:ech hydrogenase subunit A
MNFKISFLKGEDAVEKVLLAVAILLPALSAALCYIIRHSATRKFIVVVSTLVLFIVAGGFVNQLLGSPNGKIIISFGDEGLSSIIHMAITWAIKLLDLILLVYVIFIGFKLKKALVVGLATLQLIPLILFEVLVNPKETSTAFVIDYLTLIMILLVSIIGPIITVFALGYMKEHEHHLKLKKSRQPRFFMILFAFLGAMNALVITNDLSWMYFFWEVTTLCSFLLISHDGTDESIKNATRALWINLLGGVAFISAIIVLYYTKNTLALDDILKVASPTEVTGAFALGLGLLCFAGFTKSAQFPFQSWLLGAMVAPTPVSALLHSSTMVKAGVYLVVRLAPAFHGTLLGRVVAVVGGFTFLAGSAIAISQSNAKRVLAYSTIANLGLIICCAGIGTPIALGAAILLIVFHALSKGLLFLCVGTIEQEIGSRDIEDMQGLMKRMPFTTIITVIGAVSMLLPPFGVMLTKWAAIEASVTLPIVLVLIVLGSAFTVVFWSKWIGILLTMSYKKKLKIEKLPFSISTSLVLLVLGVLTASVGVEKLFEVFVKPWINGGDVTLFNGFAPLWFFIVLFAVVLTFPLVIRKTKPEHIRPPYLCGENVDNDIRGLQFMSPGDKAENVVVRNYYLSGFFGEKNLTLWVNIVAGAIILVMFGVVR